MAQFTLLLLLVTNPKQLCIRSFRNSFTLSPSVLGGEGIQIQLTENNVNTINNSWHIDPISQDGGDIEIELDQRWGFHPSVESSLHLTIDGYTPAVTTAEGEFFILFSVDDTQYFSVEIALEQSQAWKSYPPYQSQALAVSSFIPADIIYVQSPPIRYHRLGNTDGWGNIGPGQWYKNALQWPLRIQITNDPIGNRSYYRCFLPDRAPLSVTYLTAFEADKGMKIYIMNDASDGKPFDVHAINISYAYNIAPSVAPTHQPSTPAPIIVIPSASPSASPVRAEGSIENVESTLIPLKDIQIINTSTSNLMLYLVIIIIVLLLCFVIVIVGFCVLYKRRKYNKIPNDTTPGPTNDNDNGRVATVTAAVSDIPMMKNVVIFNDELKNFGAGNDALMGDIFNDMATRGGDGNINIDESEEGEEGDGNALSGDDRTKNMYLQAVDTLIDDDYETIQ